MPGLNASHIRLDLQERTWQYLFVDEIRLLGGAPDQTGVLPVQDVTLDITDADGNAALLEQPGDALDVTLPLTAGDYTIRAHSCAVELDTFSELAVSANGTPARAHPVTNAFFTWQRSHFTQDADGPATIALALIEGPGIRVDQVRVHRLDLNEPIATLREFTPDTVLVADGESRCLIAHDDEGDYADQASALADLMEQRAGLRPAVVSGAAVTADDLRERHVIGLGDRTTNFALLRARPNLWNFIPVPPEDGSAQIYVAVEPLGTGTNVIALGGTTADQVAASVAEFTGRLQGDTTLVYPFELVPPPGLTADRERYRQLAIDSGKWLREGALRTIFNRWKAFSDDLFIMFGYRYLEYLDSSDTIQRASDAGFIEAETYKIISRFDRSQHNGAMDQRQLLQMTNVMLRMARECENAFDWNCCQEPGVKKRHHTPEECDRILSERTPAIANNHQTFPSYSILTCGDWFAKYYDLPEARRWIDWASTFMLGQLLSAKPQCDCWGYQDITMLHTARHAAIVGDWDYFSREPVYGFLRLRAMSHDNMGAPVGYGDVGGYSPGGGPDYLAANAAKWTNASAGRLDTTRITAESLLGLYVHPVEPMWYERNGADATAPLDRCFDKLSFREALDADRAYLLLDGISRGYHGHWDGNSILRFTDDGRVWLCEGDYLKGALKDHNTLTVMRDAQSALPTTFSSLEFSFASPTWASTITRTPDYCGLDWDRHIIWHRPTDTFVLIDEVTAREPGLFDLNARFRSLGETTLTDGLWTVHQQGDRSFSLHAPGAGRLTEATESADAKNWQRYEFVDDHAPKLLSRRLARQLAAGERQSLPCIFYAGGDQPRLSVRALGSALVTDGSLALVTGAGDLDTEHLVASAAHYAIGSDALLLAGATSLAAGRPLMQADQPVHLSLDLKTGRGVVQTAQAVSFSITCDHATVLTVDGRPAGVGEGVPLVVQLAAGRHELTGEFGAMARDLGAAIVRLYDAAPAAGTAVKPEPTAGIEPEALQHQLPDAITALEVGDLTGDDADEIVAGCADGSLVVFDAAGTELWSHKFAGKINDVELADLDGDGRADVVCGVEDALLHAFAGDGTGLLHREFETRTASGGGPGHVRALHVADFDGDGQPEIAVACANTRCYVVDTLGQVKTSDGRAWEWGWRHKASAVHSADVTGDGHLELLAGWTYGTRWIVDFTDTSKRRNTAVPGSIAGCRSITAADLDGDGIDEAIFADGDGQVTVCRKAPAVDRKADVLWSQLIGDDAHERVLAADLDGDGAPEIALASRSGFLALVGADGTVRWARYADNQVTDVALMSAGGRSLLARSSLDGSVAVHDASGDEVARWLIGSPVQLIRAHGDAIVAAAGDTLLVATLAKP